MYPVAGEAALLDGVDAVRWMPLSGASAVLTHERDHAVLEALTAAPRS